MKIEGYSTSKGLCVVVESSSIDGQIKPSRHGRTKTFGNTSDSVKKNYKIMYHKLKKRIQIYFKMEKINHLYQILIENKDFYKFQGEQSTIKFEKYKEAFLEFIEIGSIKDLNLIMTSLDDWENEGILFYNFLDEVIEFGKLDSKNFVNNFLQNLHLMYPHAKKGIHYIFNHLLTMEQFLPYLYDTFLAINISEKRIFKEIYEEITMGDSLVPEIDEALKLIK